MQKNQHRNKNSHQNDSKHSLPWGTPCRTQTCQNWYSCQQSGQKPRRAQNSVQSCSRLMASSQFWLVSPRGGARGTVQAWDRQVSEKSFRWGVLGGRQQRWGSCHLTSHCLCGLLPPPTPRSKGRSPCLAQAYSREPPEYLLDEQYAQSRWNTSPMK